MDNNPSPQLHSARNNGKESTNKFVAILRSYSLIHHRPKVIVDSEDMDLLCQAIHQLVIASFLKNRNKVYLEICCWTFSKSLKTADKKIPHDHRFCINNHFPPKMVEADILPAIKNLLLAQSQSAGRLAEGVLEVPFVNLPHGLSQPPMAAPLGIKALEELAELKKRDLELFELVNPLVESLAKCSGAFDTIQTDLYFHKDMLDCVNTGVVNLISKINHKFETLYDTMRALGSRVTELETEMSYLRRNLPKQHP